MPFLCLIVALRLRHFFAIALLPAFLAAIASLAAFSAAPAFTVAFHCRFSLPHLSYITTLHSHITEIHAPWRPRTFHLPRLLHAFACLYMALHSTADFETFCTQVGLRGGVQRVHKHTRHGGVSWRGRDRQPIRQAATRTAISANVFQPERPKPTSTASPTSTSRDGFGTNFCYRNQMRDSAQGLVLQLVEAFLSRLATYEPTQ